MIHSVKLTLDPVEHTFYYAYEEGNPKYILDLCAKYINKLWKKTKDAKNIVVKVSEKEHEGSRRIYAIIKITPRNPADDYHLFYWSTQRIEEQIIKHCIDSLAGDWILERFPFFKDEQSHSIYVSAVPD